MKFGPLNSTQLPKALGTNDLNDIISSGIYYQTADKQSLAKRNYPINEAGFLEVFVCADGWMLQRYTPYNSSTVYKRAWYRTWLQWSQI